MRRHTAGPWVVSGLNEALVGRSGATGTRIAEVTVSELPDAEVRANAVLIATAPELRTTLEVAQQVVGRMAPTEDLDELLGLGLIARSLRRAVAV